MVCFREGPYARPLWCATVRYGPMVLVGKRENRDACDVWLLDAMNTAHKEPLNTLAPRSLTVSCCIALRFFFFQAILREEEEAHQQDLADLDDEGDDGCVFQANFGLRVKVGPGQNYGIFFFFFYFTFSCVPEPDEQDTRGTFCAVPVAVCGDSGLNVSLLSLP